MIGRAAAAALIDPYGALPLSPAPDALPALPASIRPGPLAHPLTPGKPIDLKREIESIEVEQI